MIDSLNIPGYRVLRELGQGGMATVYLAIQEKLEREVALKVMSPCLNRDPSFAIRFQREAGIVAKLSHASIVQVIDAGQCNAHPYLVMEYLPGGDLKQRIEGGECGLNLALKVCFAIAAALDFAHSKGDSTQSKGCVHRDIKPANILFRADGTPVLTDFGIARPMAVSSQLTEIGTLVGTLDYMSPEQAIGADLDGRSDLYSLGVVFYEVLTGCVPYRADTTPSLIRMHTEAPPPRLPEQFEAFQSFVDQLMAKERARRCATGAEVIRVLQSVSELARSQLRAAPSSTPEEATVVRPTPPPAEMDISQIHVDAAVSSALPDPTALEDRRERRPKQSQQQPDAPTPAGELKAFIETRAFDAYCDQATEQQFVRFAVEAHQFPKEDAVIAVEMALEELGIANERKLLRELDDQLHLYTDRDHTLDKKERADAIQMACRPRLGYRKGLSIQVTDAYIEEFCRRNHVRQKKGWLG